MDFTKSVTNKGILCILFNDQKYRFLQEMASDNVNQKKKKKCSARTETDKPTTKIFRVGGELLHRIANDRDAQCHDGYTIFD
jgi:hypothetical protein